MQLVIDPAGRIDTIYDEALDLAAFGRMTVTRAGHVEPGRDGSWTADLRPVGGPVLGPFGLRSEALKAERAWLQENWPNRPR